MSSLIIIEGENRGQSVGLGMNASITIGRGEDCDLQITDDLISRRHLQVSYDTSNSSYVATDLDSANGMSVGGQPAREARLRNGIIIEIGTTRLLFSDRNFADHQEAMAFVKTTGEQARNTMEPGQRSVDLGDEWANA